MILLPNAKRGAGDAGRRPVSFPQALNASAGLWRPAAAPRTAPASAPAASPHRPKRPSCLTTATAILQICSAHAAKAEARNRAGPPSPGARRAPADDAGDRSAWIAVENADVGSESVRGRAEVLFDRRTRRRIPGSGRKGICDISPHVGSGRSGANNERLLVDEKHSLLVDDRNTAFLLKQGATRVGTERCEENAIKRSTVSRNTVAQSRHTDGSGRNSTYPRKLSVNDTVYGVCSERSGARSARDDLSTHVNGHVTTIQSALVRTYKNPAETPGTRTVLRDIKSKVPGDTCKVSHATPNWTDISFSNFNGEERNTEVTEKPFDTGTGRFGLTEGKKLRNKEMDVFCEDTSPFKAKMSNVTIAHTNNIITKYDNSYKCTRNSIIPSGSPNNDERFDVLVQRYVHPKGNANVFAHSKRISDATDRPKSSIERSAVLSETSKDRAMKCRKSLKKFSLSAKLYTNGMTSDIKRKSDDKVRRYEDNAARPHSSTVKSSISPDTFRFAVENNSLRNMQNEGLSEISDDTIKILHKNTEIPRSWYTGTLRGNSSAGGTSSRKGECNAGKYDDSDRKMHDNARKNLDAVRSSLNAVLSRTNCERSGGHPLNAGIDGRRSSVIVERPSSCAKRPVSHGKSNTILRRHLCSAGNSFVKSGNAQFSVRKSKKVDSKRLSVSAEPSFLSDLSSGKSFLSAGKSFLKARRSSVSTEKSLGTTRRSGISSRRTGITVEKSDVSSARLGVNTGRSYQGIRTSTCIGKRSMSAGKSGCGICRQGSTTRRSILSAGVGVFNSSRLVRSRERSGGNGTTLYNVVRNKGKARKDETGPRRTVSVSAWRTNVNVRQSGVTADRSSDKDELLHSNYVMLKGLEKSGTNIKKGDIKSSRLDISVKKSGVDKHCFNVAKSDLNIEIPAIIAEKYVVTAGERISSAQLPHSSCERSDHNSSQRCCSAGLSHIRDERISIRPEYTSANAGKSSGIVEIRVGRVASVGRTGKLGRSEGISDGTAGRCEGRVETYRALAGGAGLSSEESNAMSAKCSAIDEMSVGIPTKIGNNFWLAGSAEWNGVSIGMCSSSVEKSNENLTKCTAEDGILRGSDVRTSAEGAISNDRVIKPVTKTKGYDDKATASAEIDTRTGNGVSCSYLYHNASETYFEKPKNIETCGVIRSTGGHSSIRCGSAGMLPVNGRRFVMNTGGIYVCKRGSNLWARRTTIQTDSSARAARDYDSSKRLVGDTKSIAIGERNLINAIRSGTCEDSLCDSRSVMKQRMIGDVKKCAAERSCFTGGSGDAEGDKTNNGTERSRDRDRSQTYGRRSGAMVETPDVNANPICLMACSSDTDVKSLDISVNSEDSPIIFDNIKSNFKVKELGFITENSKNDSSKNESVGEFSCKSIDLSIMSSGKVSIESLTSTLGNSISTRSIRLRAGSSDDSCQVATGSGPICDLSRICGRRHRVQAVCVCPPPCNDKLCGLSRQSCVNIRISCKDKSVGNSCAVGVASRRNLLHLRSKLSIIGRKYARTVSVLTPVPRIYQKYSPVHRFRYGLQRRKYTIPSRRVRGTQRHKRLPRHRRNVRFVKVRRPMLSSARRKPKAHRKPKHVRAAAVVAPRQNIRAVSTGTGTISKGDHQPVPGSIPHPSRFRESPTEVYIRTTRSDHKLYRDEASGRDSAGTVRSKSNIRVSGGKKRLSSRPEYAKTRKSGSASAPISTLSVLETPGADYSLHSGSYPLLIRKTPISKQPVKLLDAQRPGSPKKEATSPHTVKLQGRPDSSVQKGERGVNEASKRRGDGEKLRSRRGMPGDTQRVIAKTPRGKDREDKQQLRGGRLEVKEEAEAPEREVQRKRQHDGQEMTGGRRRGQEILGRRTPVNRTGYERTPQTDGISPTKSKYSAKVHPFRSRRRPSRRGHATRRAISRYRETLFSLTEKSRLSYPRRLSTITELTLTSDKRSLSRNEQSRRSFKPTYRGKRPPDRRKPFTGDKKYSSRKEHSPSRGKRLLARKHPPRRVERGPTAGKRSLTVREYPVSIETPPPSREASPPSRETRPSSRETRPPSRETRPPSRETRSPSRETRPSSRETRPPSRESVPPSRKRHLPRRETHPPSNETHPSSREKRSSYKDKLGRKRIGSDKRPSTDEESRPVTERRPSKIHHTADKKRPIINVLLTTGKKSPIHKKRPSVIAKRPSISMKRLSYGLKRRSNRGSEKVSNDRERRSHTKENRLRTSKKHSDEKPLSSKKRSPSNQEQPPTAKKRPSADRQISIKRKRSRRDRFSTNEETPPIHEQKQPSGEYPWPSNDKGHSSDEKHLSVNDKHFSRETRSAGKKRTHNKRISNMQEKTFVSDKKTPARDRISTSEEYPVVTTRPHPGEKQLLKDKTRIPKDERNPLKSAKPPRDLMFSAGSEPHYPEGDTLFETAEKCICADKKRCCYCRKQQRQKRFLFEEDTPAYEERSSPNEQITPVAEKHCLCWVPAPTGVQHVPSSQKHAPTSGKHPLSDDKHLPRDKEASTSEKRSSSEKQPDRTAERERERRVHEKVRGKIIYDEASKEKRRVENPSSDDETFRDSTKSSPISPVCLIRITRKRPETCPCGAGDQDYSVTAGDEETPGDSSAKSKETRQRPFSVIFDYQRPHPTSAPIRVRSTPSISSVERAASSMDSSGSDNIPEPRDDIFSLCSLASTLKDIPKQPDGEKLRSCSWDCRSPWAQVSYFRRCCHRHLSANSYFQCGLRGTKFWGALQPHAAAAWFGQRPAYCGGHCNDFW